MYLIVYIYIVVKCFINLFLLFLNAGIRRLIADGTYLAAYPLHEVIPSSYPLFTSLILIAFLCYATSLETLVCVCLCACMCACVCVHFGLKWEGPGYGFSTFQGYMTHWMTECQTLKFYVFEIADMRKSWDPRRLLLFSSLLVLRTLSNMHLVAYSFYQASKTYGTPGMHSDFQWHAEVWKN